MTFDFKNDIIKVILFTYAAAVKCGKNIKNGVIVMNIRKTQNADNLNIAVEGRLDTATAPELEAEFKSSLDGASTLVLDFEKLDYISSAGLRVLLSAQKVMAKKGGMKVINVNENVMEIFDVTGFSDILDIE